MARKVCLSFSVDRLGGLLLRLLLLDRLGANVISQQAGVKIRKLSGSLGNRCSGGKSVGLLTGGRDLLVQLGVVETGLGQFGIVLAVFVLLLGTSFIRWGERSRWGGSGSLTRCLKERRFY